MERILALCSLSSQVQLMKEEVQSYIPGTRLALSLSMDSCCGYYFKMKKVPDDTNIKGERKVHGIWASM